MFFGGFKNREKKEAVGRTPQYIIAGLGNPGEKYALTRHNIGFHFIDRLAAKYGVPVNKLKFKGLYGIGVINGVRCMLLKPQTFMNHSGESVSQAARFYKIPPENIIVAFDDISLPAGRLRIRKKGSDGGHKGIKSVIAYLQSDEFPRIKIGVGGKPDPDFDLADWVLSKITPDDEKKLAEAIDRAMAAAGCMVSENIDSAMSKYNG